MPAPDLNMGRLYRGIKGGDEISFEDEEKPVIEKDSWYVSICKKLAKQFPNFKNKEISKTYQDALDFLGWNIRGEELNASIKAVTIFSIIGAVILLVIGYLIFGPILAEFLGSFYIILILLAVFGGLAGGIIYLFMQYPLFAAEQEARQALSYVPEIISYLAMSMKLTSNLERAVSFAAARGKGKLADDLKKVIWNTHIGVHNTVSEGLEVLAYKWKNYSPEFKEAIMLIKSSMIEDDEEKRAEILDKSISSVLDSIKIKMEGYARSLSQPSLILFYVGVLLPLLLIVVLPIGSVFANLPFSKGWVLVLLYDILIPGICLLFALFIIRKVPRIYKPPVISDNYPGLPKKNNMRLGKMQIDIKIVVAFILIVGIVLSVLLQVSFGNTLQNVMAEEQFPDEYVKNPDLYFDTLAKAYLISNKGPESVNDLDLVAKQKKTQELLFTMQPGHDTTPYYIIYGLMLTLALCIFVYFYFSAKYKKEVQDYYVKMEDEFREVLYILSSRLAEGKPIEDALQKTKDFFPELTISQDLFAKTMDNVNLLGLPLEQAMFDPTFGSMKHNPSLQLNNSLKILADSVALGPHTASKTALSISIQIKNVNEIKLLIKKVISDISEMLATMATFIAPAVLGITVSLQKIIVLTLYSLTSSGLGEGLSNISSSTPEGLSSMDFSKLASSFNTDAIGNIATPGTFMVIIAINVMLIVMILAYFVSLIIEDNILESKLLIAKTLPIAVVVFIISSIVAGMLVSGFG